MPLLQPTLPTSPKQRRFWITPDGSATSLAIACAAQQHDGLLVVAARDNLRARQWEDELAVFAGDLPVLHFPDWETLPYDLFSPHPEIVSQRIATLYRLSGVRRGILIVPVSTLMQRLAPRSYITGSGLAVHQGQTLDMEAEQR
ncbi:MAG TPA: transcription-repair coupling factor, partial [Oleiagrimonas sp.]|nr:transcription-repair coupling factor [Oleiagrimonas sp.]